MIKGITAATLLGMAALLSAAPVYTCQSGGQTVYTSEPAGHCRQDALPGISRYEGGVKQAAAQTGKRKKATATKTAKTPKTDKKRSKKAAVNPSLKDSQQRIKGKGYRAFPTMARKEQSK